MMNANSQSALMARLILLCLTFFVGHSTLRGQVLVPDLRIDTDAFTEVFAGGTFDVTFRIFNDGTEEVFAGENITWSVEVNGPDGQAVPSLSRTGQILTGLSINQSTPDNTVNLRMPWAQAAQWSNNASWTVITNVITPRDVNGTNNRDTSTFSLVIPDVTINNLVGPATALPGRNVSVSGTVANVGRVQTQPNVYFRVEARLLQDGEEVDKQSIVLPNQNALNPFPFASGDTIDFTIDELSIPIDGNGTYDVTVNVDAGSPDILIEHTENNNQATVQFNVSPTANMQVVNGSFSSDTGTFQGMAPAHFRFAVRNAGTGPVQAGDAFQATVALSRDQSGIDGDDFILREFDLGGSGLGLGLRPNETVTLDWIQRLPDSFEGDFYIVANLGGQTFVSQPTPSITLRSNNAGDTTSVSESRNNWSSRPSYDQTGQYVAFESSVGGVVNIFLLDTLSNQETQVTRSFNNTAANGSSFAPSVSADGKFLAFHSSASNLVPGDTNEHADVFLFDRVANRIFRLSTSTDFGNPDGGSYYPSINGDGSVVAFESLASNLSEAPQSFSGSNIFVWDSNGTNLNKLSPITAIGNFASIDADISEDGNRVVFTSYADNFTLSNIDSSTDLDNNEYSDIFLWERNTSAMYLVNVTSGQARTIEGASSEPAISGDGKIIAYTSSAKNLVTEKGISTIEIKDAGVGYTLTPSIAITDTSGLGSGATAEAQINSYGEIIGVSVLLPGNLYRAPKVTVVPDPADIGPTRLAILEARLTHPEGDVYRVPVQSLIDNKTVVNRASESVLSVGGDKGSREPTLNYDGGLLAYSTQASNLLAANIEREDRRVFPNATFRMARARAILGGPIGEIEVQNSGEGYQDGQLRIEDLSGSGSGALALYHVDNYGRIADISIFNSGNNYDYSQTMISIDNPRAGTGFQLKSISHPVTSGIGNNRSGGGTILRLEMDDEGLGYTKEQVLNQGAGIIIDGDGADLDNDGKPDAKVNPDRIHLGPNGEVFLEQRIRLVVQSTVGLHGATLTVSDHLKTETLTFDAFSANVVGNSIGISGLSVVGVRDAVAQALEGLWPTDTNSPLYEGLQVSEKTLGADFLVVSALRGRATSGNPSSLTATMQSNMLVGGTGFTRATPIIAPDPVIFGFSEINTNISSGMMSNGRPALLVNKDQVTDDIYLYDHSKSLNERITTSKFGLPVNYRTNATTTMPSNRFPSITGNGRFISYSSDVQGAGGLLFGATNQNPADTNGFRDIYVHDRKTEALKTTSEVTVILSDPDPVDQSRNKFLLGNEVEISFIAETTQGTVESINVFVNNQEGIATQTFPAPGVFSREGRFLFKWTPDRPGTYHVSATATNSLGETSLETNLSTSIIEITNESTGLLPIAILEEPVPGGVGGDTFPDYSVGSELFVNVRAYDPDGHLEYIRFFYNDTLLGEPEYRFGDVYAFRWKVTLAEDFIFKVEVMDNDGNVVRTESLAGTNANNTSPRPEVSLDTVSISAQGMRLRALAKGNGGGGFFGFGNGVSRVQFFANGVTLERVTNGTPILNSEMEEFETTWMPPEAGVYQFHAMAVGNVGDFGDHYVISDPITFEVRPEHIESQATPNSPPTVTLLQPGEHTKKIARAHAVLHSTNDPNDPHFGQVARIVMDDMGSDYIEEPNVIIAGGGGIGAQATASVLNPNAVSVVTVLNGGSGYTDEVKLSVDDSNGSGLEMKPHIVNGVLTSIPVLTGGMGYTKDDIVKIFDLQNTNTKGTGALAGLGVDENGTVTEIQIFSGGNSYVPNYLRVVVDSKTGNGFDANEAGATVKNGVIASVEVVSAGSDYNASTISADPASGDGNFSAQIKAEHLRIGGISVTLDQNGSGYQEVPRVIFSEGRHLSSDYPFQFVLGSRVILEAEGKDVDGQVTEVRFYGNGSILGASTNGNLGGLTIVNPGAGFDPQAPPQLGFAGGGGTGAAGTVTVNANGVINGVTLTNPGTGYTTPPTVTITPGGGAVIDATLDATVINSARKIPGTDHFILEWIPDAPGVYEISAEAIDDGMKSAFHSAGHHVIIIPGSPSQIPSVSLTSPTNGEAITGGSEMRFYASASDPDGKLEWVRFYVNGVPYGEPITAAAGKGQKNFPYSTLWTAGSGHGVHSVVAVGMDNSGNSVMSNFSTLSSTSGSGSLPDVALAYPVRNAEITATWGGDHNNTIVPVIKHGGVGYASSPEIAITGANGADVSAMVQTDSTKPNFGTIESLNMKNHGIKDPNDSNITINVSGGFPVLKPSGESAEAVLRLRLDGVTFRVQVLDGGSGYKSAPQVEIQGGGTGMTATATIANESVTAVTITNQGNGYTPGTPVTFRGGFNFNEIPLTAEASDADGYVSVVTFYENGVPIPGGQDAYEPYEAIWSPGSAGVYELYAVARDNHGNKKVSSVIKREVFESIPPSFEFEPLNFADLSLTGLLDENNILAHGEVNASNILFRGKGYHSAPELYIVDGDVTSPIGTVTISPKDEDNNSSGQINKVMLTGGGKFSPAAKFVFKGGLNTAIKPMTANLGEAVFIGIQANDPDTLINNNGFQVFVNGTEDTALQVGGAYPHYSLLWDPPSLGLFDIRVHGNSIDGLSARTKTLSINVERGKVPTVEMMVPRTKESQDEETHLPTYTAGIPVHFVFNASDPDGEISQLFIYSGATQIGQFGGGGGGGGGVVTRDGTTSRYSFTWTPTIPGVHEITARAIDNTNQESFSWPISIKIVEMGGSLPPEVEFVFPNAGLALTSTSMARIYATGSDPDGSVQSLDFYINGHLLSEHNVSSVTDTIKRTFSTEWNVSRSEMHTLHAEIRDNSGNGVMSNAITVTSTTGSGDAPKISLRGLNETPYLINDSLFLEAMILDPNPNIGLSFGVQWVGFLVNGVSVDTGGAPDTLPPYYTTWTPTQPGIYEILAYARDEEGNLFFSAPSKVTVVSETSEILAFTSLNRPLSGNAQLGALTISSTNGNVRRSGFGASVVGNTNISGLSTSFMTDLVPGQIIRFGRVDSATGQYVTTENTFKVTKILSTDTLEIEEKLTNDKGEPLAPYLNDFNLLQQWLEVQVVEVYRAGSWIFLAADQTANTPNVASVRFYVGGILVSTDTTWPFSSGFIPADAGSYSIRAIATDQNGIEKLAEKRIEVLPQIGELPDGAYSHYPSLTRQGATTRGSRLVFVPAIVDLDDGVNRVEFYLNGQFYHVDDKAPFYCIFSPDSSTSLFETDRFWELTAVAVDNSDNRISLTDRGTVAGSVQLPEATMISPLPETEYTVGQVMNITVEVKGVNLPRVIGPDATAGNNPNAAQQARQMALFANGAEIGLANETSFGSGRFTFEWSTKQEVAGSDDKVDLFGAVVMQNETIGGMTYTPSIVSSPITITLTKRNPLGEMKSAVSQFYKDLLFYEPSEQEVELSLDYIGGGTHGEYIFNDTAFLNWVSNISQRQSFQDLVSAVAGYYITMGYWPSKNLMDDALQTYSAIPNYGTDGSGDTDGDGYSTNQEVLWKTSDTNATDFPDNAFRLGSYLDMTFSSLPFLRTHGAIGPFNGDENEFNRRSFVTLLFGNKHGLEPTLQQQVQGSYRIKSLDPQQAQQNNQQQQMIQQMMMYSMMGGGFGGGGRGNNNNNNNNNNMFGGGFGGGMFGGGGGMFGGGGNNQPAPATPNYKNGDGAVLFTTHMVLEEQVDGLDLLWEAPKKQHEFQTAAAMLALWQDNLVSLDQAEINKYSSMPMASQIQAMMKDHRYRSRFANMSISKDAEEHQTAKDWKYLPWLGFYSDRTFPWIYHTGGDDSANGLGWVYVQAPTSKEAWFYISGIGWMWSSESIWNNEKLTANGSLLPLFDSSSGKWTAYRLGSDPAKPGRLFYDYDLKEYEKR